jgi:hypothetical protein
MSPLAAVSAHRVSADLFAAHSASESGQATLSIATVADEFCGTVPHKFPPPPPPPGLDRFARVTFATPTRVVDDWCGTVPRKLPFPPPPPPPWVDGINQMLNSR